MAGSGAGPSVANQDSDNQVDNNGEIEEDLTPDRHVRSDPEEEQLSVVPFHLVKHVAHSFENRGHFDCHRLLVVALSRDKDAHFRVEESTSFSKKKVQTNGN